MTLNNVQVFEVCIISPGEWRPQAVTGTAPPPLRGFSFVALGKIAVLFGGWYKDDRLHNNDVYTFAFATNVSDVVELCIILCVARSIGGESELTAVFGCISKSKCIL